MQAAFPIIAGSTGTATQHADFTADALRITNLTGAPVTFADGDFANVTIDRAL